MLRRPPVYYVGSISTFLLFYTIRVDKKNQLIRFSQFEPSKIEHLRLKTCEVTREQHVIRAECAGLSIEIIDSTKIALTRSTPCQRCRPIPRFGSHMIGNWVNCFYDFHIFLGRQRQTDRIAANKSFICI